MTKDKKKLRNLAQNVVRAFGSTYDWKSFIFYFAKY